MLDTLQALVAITLINLAMSGDNALVIGMVARALPKHQRRLAMTFGAGAAVAMRLGAAVIITFLLTVPYLELLGGLAIVVIAYRLVRPEAATAHHKVGAVTTLREAITAIVVADFAMSLDNMLGVAAAAHGDIGLLVFGLGLSIPIVVFGGGLVVRLLDRFPQTMWIGAIVLIFTGADLILADPALSGLEHPVPNFGLVLGFALLGLVLLARVRDAALALVLSFLRGQRITPGREGESGPL